NNYNFNYAGGTLTITQAVIDVTANNATREYGDANPVFTGSYAGFKNGEDSTVFATPASATSTTNNLSNAGTYAISASGATAANYSFNYIDGVLTVGKATVTATIGDGTREYGDANPVFT